MNLNSISRRQFGLSAASLAGLMALGACGVSDPSGSSAASGATTTASGNIKLRVNWWGGSLRATQTQKALDAYHKKYSNVTLNGEYSDWGGYWDKLATATAGGNAPDVYQMDFMYVTTYAGKGAARPLDDLSTLDLSGIDSKVVDLGKVDGKLYAMPLGLTVFGVMVNMDVLKKLNISLPNTDTWTWEEYGAFAKKITDASGGQIYGSGLFGSQQGLSLWARQRGEELFDGDKISISPATVQSFLQMSLDWTLSGAAASASHQAELGSASLDQLDFSTGKQALHFATNTQLPAFSAAANGADMRLVQMPSTDANKTAYQYQKASMYWSVSSKTSYPADAAKVINYLINDPEAGKILLSERGIPVNSDIVKTISPQLDTSNKRAAEFSDLVAKHVGDSPSLPPDGTADFETTLTRYTQDVSFKKKTPAAAATAFIKEIQTAINQA